MLAKSIVVAPSRVVTVKVGKIGRHNAFCPLTAAGPSA